MSERIDWLPDGSARSSRFDERYHSCAGALTQARAVFLGGCHLPERWRNRHSFSILETGFGLGANFLASWAAWHADAHRCEVLDYVSIEAYPVSAEDLSRAIEAAFADDRVDTGAQMQSERDALGQALLAAWSNLRPGLQRFDLLGGRLRLTLAVGDVVQALPWLDVAADAVFLDGFSPRVNPQMWSQQTLHLISTHCQPGTRVASYTVAAAVRASLKALGFAVYKCKGLAPKRDRLEAVFLARDGAAAVPTDNAATERKL